MKKLLVVLLSLGLIVAFSATASAVDVKFSGEYYVAGGYDNNRTLADVNTVSKAVFATRTRVKTVFEVAEGLSMTTRFDALEKMWGSVGQNTTVNWDASNSRIIGSSTTTALQENIEMEQGYITFKAASGTFQVGYQDADVYGTVFGDTPTSRPKIAYSYPIGAFTIGLVYEKNYEANSTTYTDGDVENYSANILYKFKGGEAGFLAKFINGAVTRPVTDYRAKYYAFVPYMKATFGAVYVEGEVIYYTGNTKEYESPTTTADVKAAGWGGYLKAQMNMGPAYFGGQVGFSSGDDSTTADKDESGPKSSTSWTPLLLFGNANTKVFTGNVDNGGTNGTTAYSSNKQNILLMTAFGGFNPTPKLNLEATFGWMKADTAPATYVSKDYGMEFDVTATYKIYDNLSYMLGAGYLWTGDYFKGTSAANKVGNDYMLLNKLTLSF